MTISASARGAFEGYLAGVDPARIRAAAIEARDQQRATDKRYRSSLEQLLNMTKLATSHRGFAASQMPLMAGILAARDRYCASHGLMTTTQARAKLEAAYRRLPCR